jgi:formate-dependent nitrite reductase membrane component NrfD
MKTLFHIVEFLASSPIWIGICGGGLIIPPILGMMHVHSKNDTNGK